MRRDRAGPGGRHATSGCRICASSATRVGPAIRAGSPPKTDASDRIVIRPWTSTALDTEIPLDRVNLAASLAAAPLSPRGAGQRVQVAPSRFNGRWRGRGAQKETALTTNRAWLRAADVPGKSQCGIRPQGVWRMCGPWWQRRWWRAWPRDGRLPAGARGTVSGAVWHGWCAFCFRHQKRA
jgi:hypothetical protein